MELVLEQQPDGMISLEGYDAAGKALIARHGTAILYMVASASVKEGFAGAELDEAKRRRMVELVREAVPVPDCQVSWTDGPTTKAAGVTVRRTVQVKGVLERITLETEIGEKGE